MITVLVISACLIGKPEACKDFRTMLDEDATASMCLMAAPQMIAKWSEENPGWEFKRVACPTEERDAWTRKEKF